MRTPTRVLCPSMRPTLRWRPPLTPRSPATGTRCWRTQRASSRGELCTFMRGWLCLGRGGCYIQVLEGPTGIISWRAELAVSRTVQGCAGLACPLLGCCLQSIAGCAGGTQQVQGQARSRGNQNWTCTNAQTPLIPHPAHRPIVSDGAVDHEDGIESVQVEKQVRPQAGPGCAAHATTVMPFGLCAVGCCLKPPTS